MRLKFKTLKYLLVLFLVFQNVDLLGKIEFDNGSSSIEVSDSCNTYIDTAISCWDGTLIKSAAHDLVGNQIAFDDGTLIHKDVGESKLTCLYVPMVVGDVTNTTTVKLQGTAILPHRFKAGPGETVDQVEVYGSYNRLEGLPLFNYPIKFDGDQNTTLTIAVQGVLNQNVELMGGKLALDDDLTLADGVSFIGTGTIDLNGRNLSFGGSDLTLSDSLIWQNASDVTMKCNIDLSSTWTFSGDCYMNSDSAVLDLTLGGTVWIMSGSRLYLTGIKIKGLGEGCGHLYFEDATSELHLRRSALELASNGDITTTYTIDTGRVYVEVGTSKIITRNDTLYFDGDSMLIVDGVYLLYDTRTYINGDNIQDEAHISEINDGQILHFYSYVPLGGYDSESSPLEDNLFLGSGDGIYIKLTLSSGSEPFDGNHWAIYFSENPVDDSEELKLLCVDDGVAGMFKDIVLRDFSSKHVSLGSGSSLFFGNNTVIELGADEDLAMTWTFEGECVVDGQGKTVTLSDDGGFEVRYSNTWPTISSSLLLKDMTIKNLSDTAIRCLDNSSTITFQNVKLLLASDYSFTTGRFEIKDKAEVEACNDAIVASFIYGVDGDVTTSSKVLEGSMLHFDRNVTFSYDPVSAHKELIYLADESSVLSLNGATLYSTVTGIQLTRGTLLVDYKCTVSNDATCAGEAIVFGDGTGSNDLNVEIMPGGSISLEKGVLRYDNIDA